MSGERRLVITHGEHEGPRHWMAELSTKPKGPTMSAVFADLPGHWPVQDAPNLPRVIGTVAALRNLPHHTILRVQSGAAAQIINDDAGHWLTYAGTDLADSLDPTDLFFDRHSMDSLVRMLPAVIMDMPA